MESATLPTVELYQGHYCVACGQVIEYGAPIRWAPWNRNLAAIHDGCPNP